MKWLIFFALLLAVIVIYALWVRPWLVERPWAQGFFTWIEPYERFIFKKSETLLIARAKMFMGLLMTVLTMTGTIDVNDILPLVPDQYDPTVVLFFKLAPMLLTVMGMMDEKLRNATTKPIELVALPQAVLEQPAVAAKVAQAELVTAKAVDAAVEAKASGAA